MPGADETGFDPICAAAHLVACGPGAALSHHSAAEVHQFDSTNRRPTALHITARRSCGVATGDGLRISRPRTPPEIITLEGLTITTRAQTVLDLAAAVSDIELRRVFESAIRGPDPAQPSVWRTDVLSDIARLVVERPRHPGATAEIRLMGRRRHDARPNGSFAETVLVQALDAVGIEVVTQPTLVVTGAGREVHEYFPDLLIVAGQAIVEVDGQEHLDARRASRDAIRQNRLVGFHVFRYTAQQVLANPERAVAELRKHLAMTTPLGMQWTVAGRTVIGNGNNWLIRPAG